jgi:misacylated tRNA(Ala) deacylase
MSKTRIYQTDAYAIEFDAVINSVFPEKKAIILSDTAFYPGGGGQPPDKGTIFIGNNQYLITGFEKSGDDIVHLLDVAIDQPGGKVRGVVDWERRYKLMRTHSAMHVLCGVIWRDYGAQVTGGNMEPLMGRMDFEFEKMSSDLVGEIEKKVNFEIGCSREIITNILPREEAVKIPDLIRTKINLLPEGLTHIRTVEIKGLDLQADGGTHVQNTKEIGKVEIVDYQSKGRLNKRVKIKISGN